MVPKSIVADDTPAESERLTHRIIPEDKLREMLDKGYITEDVFRSALAESKEASERKELVDRMVEDRSYPFHRSKEDIIEDHKRRLIDDDQFEMFTWYNENRPSGTNGGTEKSFKLKLSCEGLRIMGRYDLCEYSCKKDSNEMTKRLYCFRGTLFEGCGNVKAPDDAFITELSEERHANVFRYLNEIRQMGLLGGNYRVSPFSEYFFDLYTRYDDSPMIHTKGTAEYPNFIKMLMYLIGAEDIRR